VHPGQFVQGSPSLPQFDGLVPDSQLVPLQQPTVQHPPLLVQQVTPTQHPPLQQTLPEPHEVPSGSVWTPQLPDVHVSYSHVPAELQVSQLAPLSPQAPMALPGWHVPPEQQPPQQLLPSQHPPVQQVPPQHRWPTPHPVPLGASCAPQFPATQVLTSQVPARLQVSQFSPPDPQ
jgi:hypothetical protein